MAIVVPLSPQQLGPRSLRSSLLMSDSRTPNPIREGLVSGITAMPNAVGFRLI